jgi:hypothetical protein
MDISSFNTLVYIWMAVALLSFPFILKITAPYGRHTSTTWGPVIDNRMGWIIMEMPALVVFAGFFLAGTGERPAITWVFFIGWVLHYVNRTLIFPFRLRTSGKKMPVAIIMMALFFNLVNGTINGYYLGTLSTATLYPPGYISDPRMISGLILFMVGFYINWQSDHILIHLRKPGEKAYMIPDKGLFKLISCPNHFGEILEWTGFAIMTWSAPGLAFALWTVVNLLPRALQHHRWYKRTFANYPRERKALIPFIL